MAEQVLIGSVDDLKQALLKCYPKTTETMEKGAIDILLEETVRNVIPSAVFSIVLGLTAQKSKMEDKFMHDFLHWVRDEKCPGHDKTEVKKEEKKQAGKLDKKFPQMGAYI